MAKTYLDETGLATLWGKIKTYVTNAVKVTGVKGDAETSYRTGNVNLTAANVGAVNKSGDTMTGQLKTSFRSSVAMGSYGANATTIENLCEELRYSSGCCGSANIKTSYTWQTITIPASWYTFLWIPHRSGGVNGAATGDNCDYGTLYLVKMNNSEGCYVIQFYLGAIARVNSFLDRIPDNYLNIHPENNPVIIPFIHNDLAFLTKKGGSVIVTYDGVAQSVDISNVFDGSGSYWVKNPTGITTIVIELTIPQTKTWNNWIYADFGNASWRAKSVKIEVMNTNYAEDTWTQKYSTTTNILGHVAFICAHTPVGASNTGGGFNKIRFTFSNWATSTIFRISQLGLYNYGSLGLRETYMSRGVDDRVYRDISPFNNNTYSLGETSYKWKNLFATTLNASNMGNNTKLLFPQTSGSDTGIEVTNATNSLGILFGIGSGQVNRGVYDRKLSKWLIHADNSNVYLNGTVVPSSPKFTDTVTTVTTTGSGNAVTGITASNGALTVTKGSTFLTQHQSNANLGHGYHTVTTPSSGVYAINAPGYNLVEGSRISVLFKNAVTVATPKLNVNSTGEKSIYYNGSALNPTAVTYVTTVIASNSVVTFVYDGVHFVITAIENPNRIVVPGYQLDSTGGNSTKQIKMSNYSLCAGSLFTVSFIHDNTVSNALTLNINETGVKTLFINGKPSSSSNCTLPAGTYLIYYDGTNYYVRTDGKYPGASSLPTREDISADFITNNMRVVVRSAIRYGKMVELELLVNRSSAWANGSNGDITATFTSNHLPYAPVETTVMWNGGVLVGTIAGAGGYINSTKTTHGQGYVLFRNLSGSSISKDNDASIPFVFRYIYDDGNITVPDLSGYNLSN